MCRLFGVPFLEVLDPHFWKPRASPPSIFSVGSMYLSRFNGHTQYVDRPYKGRQARAPA